MNERQPEATDLDDPIEEKIDYIMNTRGFSRADAEHLLSERHAENPQFTREESRYYHPSATARRLRLYRGRPPVGEDSKDVFTGILSDAQVMTNTRGIALARQVLSASQSELTPQERAIARAKAEKKNRNN
jgi:hypothetical protein